MADRIPNVRGRHLGDSDYFPLYAEAERLEVPILVPMFLGRFPGASQPIVEHPKLSDPSKSKFLDDNAHRLYPLD